MKKIILAIIILLYPIVSYSADITVEMLNKRADVLKTLKKVTKTKVPKGAKSIEAASNYEKDFKKVYDALPKTKKKLSAKDLKGKSTKEVMEMLLKQGFTPTPTAKYKSPAKQKKEEKWESYYPLTEEEKNTPTEEEIDQERIQQQIEGTYVETEEDLKRRKEELEKDAPRNSPAKPNKGKDKALNEMLKKKMSISELMKKIKRSK